MEPLLISVPNPAQFIARDVGNTEVYELWNFINALVWDISDYAHLYERRVPYPPDEDGRGGGPGLPPEVLIAIVSSSALSTLINVIYQGVSKYLTRHEGRELTLERGGTRVTLKGRSLPEEMELIRQLFPEALENRTSSVTVEPSTEISSELSTNVKGLR